MRQRLEHIDPGQNQSNRHAVAIGETDEHWLVVIVYAQGPPGQLVYAVLKSEYVVVPEKKVKAKPVEDDGGDLI
jgi:hypothetical protein